LAGYETSINGRFSDVHRGNGAEFTAKAGRERLARVNVKTL
jgi:hypothetical protein